MDILENDYLSFFKNPPIFDESTLRKKLKEYEELGLVVSEKQGKQLLYRLNDSSVNLREWEAAILFFSEVDPLGVVGSYLLDRLPIAREFPYFGFKHHYILHALESEVLYTILEVLIILHLSYKF